eukprot:9385971-Ditylum_brightwellii.AAC.1
MDFLIFRNGCSLERQCVRLNILSTPGDMLSFEGENVKQCQIKKKSSSDRHHSSKHLNADNLAVMCKNTVWVNHG